MQSNLIFDYQDKIYQNQNPLNFLIRKEINETLRKTFYLLDETERFIINEIILKEKSITNTALLLDINEKEIKEKLELCLEILYHLFKHTYY